LSQGQAVRSGEPEAGNDVENAGFQPQFMPHLLQGANDKM